MRAVLFDALGTLVRLEPPAPALRLELGRLGVEVSVAAAEDAIASEIAYYRAHLDDGRDVESLRVLRRGCAEALRGALPAVSGVEADALVQALLASLRFSAFEDAVPALAALREGGARVVVVSNWDVSLHDVLERVGLRGRVDGVVTSAEVGARKPAAEMFRAALAVAGVGPEEAVHVGDSLKEDVEGARGAGVEPILLVRGGSSGPPGVRTIASLLELFGEP